MVMSESDPVETTPQPVRRAGMKARPNWETYEGYQEEDDRLRIPKELIPDGMSLKWVTESVYEKQFPERLANAERGGWTVVNQMDFGGAFNGRFMKKDLDEPIRTNGLILVARPQELTDKAERNDQRKAIERVRAKERAMLGGDLGTSLDARHPTAVRSNRINRTLERIEIPED